MRQYFLILTNLWSQRTLNIIYRDISMCIVKHKYIYNEAEFCGNLIIAKHFSLPVNIKENEIHEAVGIDFDYLFKNDTNRESVIDEIAKVVLSVIEDKPLPKLDIVAILEDLSMSPEGVVIYSYPPKQHSKNVFILSILCIGVIFMILFSCRRITSKNYK